jgi:hypothetical protein
MQDGAKIFNIDNYQRTPTSRSPTGGWLPRYFFDVEDSHTLLIQQALFATTISQQSSEATVLSVGISLDKPEDDSERRIAIINDQGHKIGNVPVYSKPSYASPCIKRERYRAISHR